MLTAGMTIEKVQIKCPAKPITHAFLQFIDVDERDNYIRSANRQTCEARGRIIRITPAMDAEERYQQKRLGYIKLSLNEMHGILFKKVFINRELKHVSIQGFIKYQDFEQKVEEHSRLVGKNSSRRL